MEIRTYLRVIIYKIFVNNVFIKILTSIVNFYYNLWNFLPANLKFKKSMPITCTDMKRNIVFLSITGDKMTVHD